MRRQFSVAGYFSIAAVIGLSIAQTATAQLIAGRSDNIEPAYYIDVNTGVPTELFSFADAGLALSGVEGLAVDDANRTIYVSSGIGSPLTQVILSAHYDDRDFVNPSHIRLRKVVDLAPGLRITGLAWDSVNNKLLAVYPFGVSNEGVYEINLTTGALTLRVDFQPASGDWDLRGFDFNPADGLFYATNLDSTPGRSLISIDANGAGTITPIVGAGALTIPESGLAIGNNRAYIVPDDDDSPSTNPIRVYNLGTGLFEADIFTPWGFNGDESAAGAGWGPNALTVPAGSNLGTTISSSLNNAIDYEVGTQATFTAVIRNFGPAQANNVSYSIVLGGTGAATINGGSISSTSGSAVEGPAGTITGSVATMFPFDTETVTFTITSTAAGSVTATSSVPPGANTDPYLGNNSEAASNVFRDYPDVVAVFTTVQSSPTSDVPSLPGSKFEFSTSSTTEKFRKPYRSANGDYVALWADTAESSTTDEVYMIKNGAGAWSVGAREGVTATTNGDLFGTMILTPAISPNNSGQFAVANDTNASTSTDETITVFDGVDFVAVAREGQPIPFFSGQGINYSSTMDSPALDGEGRAAFRVASMGSPVPSAQNSVLLADNGTRLLAQKGVTIPEDQAGGATETWEAFDSDALSMDCLGQNWLVQGDLTGSTSGDDVLVVNGVVVLQQGSGVIGLTGTLGEPGSTAGVISAEMYGNGDWYARGVTTDSNQDFVLKGNGTSYSVIAKNGDETYPGSGEFWSDVDGFSPTFFGYAGNSQGDYVIVGRTDVADTGRNTAVVLNGTTQLFQEGDRVDLDLNGQFDDDAFINTFLVDWMTLTDSGDFYCVVNLRDGSGSFIGKALLRIAAPVSPIPAGADVTVSKSVSDNFLESVGQQTTFTIRVCNYGPNSATNVVMTDTLPAGLDFVSATNGAVETAPGSNVVTATIPALGSCMCESYDVVVDAIAEGVWNNTASATANEADPNGANNSGSVSVTVQNQADLSVTKVDDGGAPIGLNFTYTVTITNNGPAVATNVMMTDNLDPTTTFVNATNGGTQSSPGVVTATFPSIGVGNSEVVLITVFGTAEALVVNNVSVSGTEVDINAGNNSAFVETLVGNFSDLAVTINADEAYQLGGLVHYKVNVSNLGPNTATNVPLAITLDPSLGFVFASGGGVENPPASGNVAVTIPGVDVLGTVTIDVYADANSAGTATTTALVDPNLTQQDDPDSGNNNAASVILIGDFAPVEAIYTEIVSSSTSIVPGALAPGGAPIEARFSSILNFTFSPDGSRWLLKGDTDQPTTEDNYLMLGSGNAGTVYAQASQPVPGGAPGELWDFFDSAVLGGFNSAGDFAFSARVKGGASGTLERVYRNIGGVTTEVLRENSLIQGLFDPNGPSGDELLGNTVSGVHLMNNGDIRMYLGNIGGLASPDSNFDTALMSWNSTTSFTEKIRQEGLDVLLPGAFEIWDEFDSEDFYTTPDGLHYFSQGDDDNASTSADDILVVDDVVVLREGSATDGVIVEAALWTNMASDGTWFTRANMLPTANGDVAFRNGLVIAKTGDSVSGGAELWGTTISSVTGNTLGDYIVVGVTNNPDTARDNVMVLNGTMELLREGDPIDLDGNGHFDDGVFLNGFNADDVFVSDDQIIYLLGSLRNSEGTSLGDAFMRINYGCPTIPADTSADIVLNGFDVQSFVDCVLAGGAPVGQCKCADMDLDGDVDVDDVVLAVALWLNQ